MKLNMTSILPLAIEVGYKGLSGFQVLCTYVDVHAYAHVPVLKLYVYICTHVHSYAHTQVQVQVR